ncbi:hypothetical protein LX66_3302 [Chitinophaga japonensis]|uniref:Uncharacterized protein n=1 Tax=Chitinophaga japonensis TaxID=104662 RepID=A0A562T7L5_CHIJA|nr:hypothetical protein LX66_3302 [Chitinophaga japonensis]
MENLKKRSRSEEHVYTYFIYRSLMTFFIFCALLSMCFFTLYA